MGLACATGEGWRRTEARTCERAAPARLCAEAQPDRGLVVRLGELALVPGECADAPEQGAGAIGPLALEFGDGDIRHRKVRLPRGRVTTVTLGEDARVRVRRDRCTDAPGVGD